jgi:hypothetical protein
MHNNKTKGLFKTTTAKAHFKVKKDERECNKKITMTLSCRKRKSQSYRFYQEEKDHQPTRELLMGGHERSQKQWK